MWAGLKSGATAFFSAKQSWEIEAFQKRESAGLKRLPARESIAAPPRTA
jgi:hypothetical protein